MFKIGDKVICVDDSGDNFLEKDSIYTIKFAGFIRNKYTVHLVEVQHKPWFLGWRPNRFVKIDPLKEFQKHTIKLKTELEKLKEVLKKEEIKEEN